MRKLEQHIEQKMATLRERHWYVACSGGLDSLCLTSALHSLGYPLTVVHVNYQLRGTESDEDAKFIEAFCDIHRINYLERTVNLAEQLKNGGNLQEEARTFRYNWFAELINADKNNAVALAHHSDDQVETFFLNLARKSGVMGLACMPFENKGIYRPLLEVSKNDLRAYAEEIELEWREDSSNSTNNYRRNRLRNVIIPFLNKNIDNLEESILILINQFQNKQRELSEKIRPFINELTASHQLDLQRYRNLDEFEKVELLRQLGQPSSLAHELDKLLSAQKGKKVELIQNDLNSFESVIRERDSLSFLPIRKKAFEPVLIIEQIDELPTNFSKEELYLDEAKISGTLQLRPWKLGDRMNPLGVSGSKLISDIIAESTIPAAQKDQVLILHDAQSILWCVGLKISSKAIATPSTTNLIKCSVIYSKSPE